MINKISMVTSPSEQHNFFQPEKNEKKPKKTKTFFNPKTETDPDRKPTCAQKTEPNPDRSQKVKTAG
jgi:hypothetical protein